MIEKQTNDAVAPPTLCEVIGAEAGSFEQFIRIRDEALDARQQKYEERTREALQEELAWAE